MPEEVLKAFDSPSHASVNVTTSLPANLREAISSNRIEIKSLIMRGIIADRMVRAERERTEEQSVYKEEWKRIAYDAKKRLEEEIARH